MLNEFYTFDWYENGEASTALEWAEALTVISKNDVPDALYDSVRENFNEKEMVALSIAIVAINGLNQLSVGFPTVREVIIRNKMRGILIV